MKWVSETRQWSSPINFKLRCFYKLKISCCHLNSKRLAHPNLAVKSQKAQFHIVTGTTALKFNISPLAPV